MLSSCSYVSMEIQMNLSAHVAPAAQLFDGMNEAARVPQQLTAVCHPQPTAPVTCVTATVTDSRHPGVLW